MRLIIYTDGGSRGNPGPAAVGIYMCDSAGTPIHEHGETIGEATNNIAEYTAVIVALELAQTHEATEIDFYVDSQLVAHQINGKYKIKTPHIRTLYNQVKDRMNQFDKVTFTHVPREHEGMRQADRLVNEALDGEL